MKAPTPPAADSAFDRFSQSWWWFDPKSNDRHAKNPVAWQWEVIRRTSAYRLFHDQASAIVPPAELTDPGKHTARLQRLAEIVRYLSEHSTLATPQPLLGRMDPRRKWGRMFHAGCSPLLHWTSLPDSTKSYLQTLAPLFPRAQLAAYFGIPPAADAVIVQHLHEGNEIMRWAGAYDAKADPQKATCTAMQGKHHSVRILSDAASIRAYIVIVFDVRAGESTARLASVEQSDPRFRLKARLDKALRDLKSYIAATPDWPRLPVRKSDVRVVPSRELFRAQAWIPADNTTEAEEILQRLATLVGPRHRRKWLPQCQTIWATPDVIKFGSREFAVSHPDFVEFPICLKSKPARAREQSKRDLQTGFCAFDCREIEPSFRQDGLLIPFLKRYPEYQSLADPVLLRDSHKKVKRFIDRIDAFYSGTLPPA